jgi:hypothetical protein
MIRRMLQAAAAMKVWVRLVCAMGVLLVLLVAVGLTAAQRIRALNDMLDHYTHSTTRCPPQRWTSWKRTSTKLMPSWPPVWPNTNGA